MSEAEDTTASAKKIAEAIAALPPLPATAQQILTCFGDEFIDADKVADVVESDPGICAKLLGLANSAYFGLPEPVNNIREAISRVLGVDTVRSLVLAMAIQQSFNTRTCPAFSARRFWMQSLLTAECCKKIVAADDKASDVDRDLAYTSGLCHNLGMMALAHMEPQKTHSVLNSFHETEEAGNLGDMFVNELETNHRIMTAELARCWSLPAPMTAAYQHRAFPDEPYDGRLGLIVVSAATAVGNMEVEDDKRTDLRVWAKGFGLDPNDLQQMAVFGERQREKVQSLVGNMSG
jgi:HD-like signal output (HDOD) protein